MSVKIAAWNVQEGLAEAGRMPQLVEQVKQFDADVVVLSDAYSLGNDLHGSRPEVLAEAEASFGWQGYELHQTEYDDSESWHHDRNLIVLNRLTQVGAAPLRLATRNAMELKVQDPDTNEPVHIVGAHFDDRSEATRLQQVGAFLGYVDNVQPTVLAGDLNTVHARDWWPKLLRSNLARVALTHVPFTRAQSIGKRLVEISSGESIGELTIGGFRDADPLHRSSFPAKLPILQPDHILLSEAAMAYYTYLAGQSAASDHRSVISTVSAR